MAAVQQRWRLKATPELAAAPLHDLPVFSGPIGPFPDDLTEYEYRATLARLLSLCRDTEPGSRVTRGLEEFAPPADYRSPESRSDAGLNAEVAVAAARDLADWLEITPAGSMVLVTNLTPGARPAARSPQSWRRKAGDATTDAATGGTGGTGGVMASQEWDGRVPEEHALDVERDNARDIELDTFDVYDKVTGAKGVYRVVVQAGWYELDQGVSYSRQGEVNDQGDVLVWRWVIYDPEGFVTDEHGPWTDQKSEAERLGQLKSADKHQEPPHQFENYRQGDLTPREVVLGGAPLQRSRAVVEVDSSVSQEDLKRVLHKLYGSDDPAVLAALTGVPDGVVLAVTSAGVYKKRFSDDAVLDAVGVRVEGTREADGIFGVSRFIGVDRAGKRMIRNEYIQTSEKGGGLGRAIFARQAEVASRDGFDYINCHAAGYAGSGYNGYATWPKFGFDMRLDDPSIKPNERKFYADVAKYFGVSTIQELMAIDAGRDWWCGYVKEDGTRVPGNGIDIRNANFDLDPDSVSMRVLKKYLEGKTAKKSANPPERPAARDDDRHTRDGKVEEKVPLELDDEDNAILDAAWREIARELAAAKAKKSPQRWRGSKSQSAPYKLGDGTTVYGGDFAEVVREDLDENQVVLVVSPEEYRAETGFDVTGGRVPAYTEAGVMRVYEPYLLVRHDRRQHDVDWRPGDAVPEDYYARHAVAFEKGGGAEFMAEELAGMDDTGSMDRFQRYQEYLRAWLADAADRRPPGVEFTEPIPDEFAQVAVYLYHPHLAEDIHADDDSRGLPHGSFEMGDLIRFVCVDLIRDGILSLLSDGTACRVESGFVTAATPPGGTSGRKGSTPSRIGDREQSPRLGYLFGYDGSMADGFDGPRAALNAHMVTFLAQAVETIRADGRPSAVVPIPGPLVGQADDCVGSPEAQAGNARTAVWYLWRAIVDAQQQFPDAQIDWRSGNRVQIVLIDGPAREQPPVLIEPVEQRSAQAWRLKGSTPSRPGNEWDSGERDPADGYSMLSGWTDGDSTYQYQDDVEVFLGGEWIPAVVYSHYDMSYARVQECISDNLVPVGITGDEGGLRFLSTFANGQIRRADRNKSSQAWRTKAAGLDGWESTDSYAARREMLYDYVRSALMARRPGESFNLDLPDAVVADQEAYARVTEPMLYVILQQLWNDGLAADLPQTPQAGGRTIVLTRA